MTRGPLTRETRISTTIGKEKEDDRRRERKKMREEEEVDEDEKKMNRKRDNGARPKEGNLPLA